MEESLDKRRKFDERPELHITLNERALSQDVIAKMDIMQEQLNESKEHGWLPLVGVKKVIMLAAVEEQLNESKERGWLPLVGVKKVIMLATVQEQLNESEVHGRLPLAEVKKVIMLAAVEEQLNECELHGWPTFVEVKKVIMLVAVQEQLNESEVHGRLPLAEVKKVIVLAAVEEQLYESELHVARLDITTLSPPIVETRTKRKSKVSSTPPFVKTMRNPIINIATASPSWVTETETAEKAGDTVWRSASSSPPFAIGNSSNEKSLTMKTIVPSTPPRAPAAQVKKDEGYSPARKGSSKISTSKSPAGKTEQTSEAAASASRVIRHEPAAATLEVGNGGSKLIAPPPSKIDAGKTEQTSKPAASTSRVTRREPGAATLGWVKGGSRVLAPPTQDLCGQGRKDAEARGLSESRAA